MSSLDDKLKEVLTQAVEAQWSEIQLSNAIAQIKQAFAEAGYFKQHTSSPEAFAELSKSMGEHLPVLMTGQEWYDRFEEAISVDSDIWELPDKMPDNLPEALLLFQERLKLAAKRAAGINT